MLYTLRDLLKLSYVVITHALGLNLRMQLGVHVAYAASTEHKLEY